MLMLKVNTLSKYENYERILELRPGEFAVYENMKNRTWLTDPTDSGKEEDVGQVHVSVYCKNNPLPASGRRGPPPAQRSTRRRLPNLGLH